MSRIVDWPLLVAKLRKYYGSYERIGAVSGRHKSWAGQLARGEVKEPKFSEGLFLLDLAADHVPENEIRECRQ